MFFQSAATAALTASIGTAKDGSPSADVSVADLDEKVDGNSSEKTMLKRSFAKIWDKTAPTQAFAHFFPVDGSCRSKER